VFVPVKHFQPILILPSLEEEYLSGETTFRVAASLGRALEMLH
jgi:hypothetical protein